MSKSPSRAVLAERIKGHEELRRQQERWERDRRAEDRVERSKKDEELNGVRFQLREQAATFATKDMLAALDHASDVRLDTAIANLNTMGTADFRETAAEQRGREEAMKQILDSTATNRRFIIGLAVTVMFGVVANGITILLWFAGHGNP